MLEINPTPQINSLTRDIDEHLSDACNSIYKLKNLMSFQVATSAIIILFSHFFIDLS